MSDSQPQPTPQSFSKSSQDAAIASHLEATRSERQSAFDNDDSRVLSPNSKQNRRYVNQQGLGSTVSTSTDLRTMPISNQNSTNNTDTRISDDQNEIDQTPPIPASISTFRPHFASTESNFQHILSQLLPLVRKFSYDNSRIFAPNPAILLKENTTNKPLAQFLAERQNTTDIEKNAHLPHVCEDRFIQQMLSPYTSSPSFPQGPLCRICHLPTLGDKNDSEKHHLERHMLFLFGLAFPTHTSTLLKQTSRHATRHTPLSTNSVFTAILYPENTEPINPGEIKSHLFHLQNFFDVQLLVSSCTNFSSVLRSILASPVYLENKQCLPGITALAAPQSASLPRSFKIPHAFLNQFVFHTPDFATTRSLTQIPTFQAQALQERTFYVANPPKLVFPPTSPTTPLALLELPVQFTPPAPDYFFKPVNKNQNSISKLKIALTAPFHRNISLYFYTHAQSELFKFLSIFTTNSNVMSKVRFKKVDPLVFATVEVLREVSPFIWTRSVQYIQAHLLSQRPSSSYSCCLICSHILLNPNLEARMNHFKDHILWWTAQQEIHFGQIINTVLSSRATLTQCHEESPDACSDPSEVQRKIIRNSVELKASSDSHIAEYYTSTLCMDCKSTESSTLGHTHASLYHKFKSKFIEELAINNKSPSFNDDDDDDDDGDDGDNDNAGADDVEIQPSNLVLHSEKNLFDINPASLTESAQARLKVIQAVYPSQSTLTDPSLLELTKDGLSEKELSNPLEFLSAQHQLQLAFHFSRYYFDYQLFFKSLHTLGFLMPQMVLDIELNPDIPNSSQILSNSLKSITTPPPTLPSISTSAEFDHKFKAKFLKQEPVQIEPDWASICNPLLQTDRPKRPPISKPTKSARDASVQYSNYNDNSNLISSTQADRRDQPVMIQQKKYQAHNIYSMSSPNTPYGSNGVPNFANYSYNRPSLSDFVHIGDRTAFDHLSMIDKQRGTRAHPLFSTNPLAIFTVSPFSVGLAPCDALRVNYDDPPPIPPKLDLKKVFVPLRTIHNRSDVRHDILAEWVANTQIPPTYDVLCLCCKHQIQSTDQQKHINYHVNYVLSNHPPSLLKSGMIHRDKLQYADTITTFPSPQPISIPDYTLDSAMTIATEPSVVAKDRSKLDFASPFQCHECFLTFPDQDEYNNHIATCFYHSKSYSLDQFENCTEITNRSPTSTSTSTTTSKIHNDAVYQATMGLFSPNQRPPPSSFDPTPLLPQILERTREIFRDPPQ